MRLKRLKYTLVAMLIITTLVVASTVMAGSTLAMIIDKTLSLVNTFAPEEITAETDVDISIEKSVVSANGAVISAGGFTFELTDLQTGNVLSAVTNAMGQASFNLAFSEEDIGQTYQYTITEVNDARPGFNYSTKVYQLQISVDLVGNDLVAAMTLDGQSVNECVAAFINYYADADAPPPPAGDDQQPALYFAMMAVSALALILIRRKQKA